MKKLIAIMVATIILGTSLAGCVSQEPAPDQSAAPPTQSEATPPEPEPVADEQPPATEPPAAEPEQLLTKFTSDYGYTISYDEDSFDYRRTEGYDEFVLKSTAVEKPYVFVCVSLVGAEFVEQMKAAALGENPEPCTLGPAQMSAQCSETTETWEGGQVIRKTYVCLLESGDALLIETQWYTEQTDDAYAAWLWEMVNSIEL